MTATSVTGRGIGSAEGANAGRKEDSMSGSRLIGPRVVASDRVAMGGAASVDVVLPKLSGVATDYVVMLTNQTSAAIVWGGLVSPFGTNDTTLTVNDATTTDTVQWAIIKVGLAI
jgi:hypothetical protein